MREGSGLDPVVAVESGRTEHIPGRCQKWRCPGFDDGLDVEWETKEGVPQASLALWSEQLRYLREGRNQELKLNSTFPLVIQMEMLKRQLDKRVRV